MFLIVLRGSPDQKHLFIQSFPMQFCTDVYGITMILIITNWLLYCGLYWGNF